MSDDFKHPLLFWMSSEVSLSTFRYGFLSHWQIKEIPVPALAAPNCLVVTWVTNRQKHLQFVKNELYPHWSIHGVVEWFWVKVSLLDLPHLIFVIVILVLILVVHFKCILPFFKFIFLHL